MDRSRKLRVLMNLSLVAAVILLLAKVTAAAMTGSSAIYSDAAESIVHLIVVCFGSYAIRVAQKPADESHHYGHDKVSYLSAGFEGVMIAVAALMIFYEAAMQFIHGVSIENFGIGVTITAAAALVNLILGIALVSEGQKHGSPLLRANGQHVLTDVWSSAAVLLALALYKISGWVWWDPIAAMLAACNILRTGYRLFRESMSGLLDEADPVIEQEIRDLLDNELKRLGGSYHNLRYRHSGMTHWVEFHLVLEDSHSIRSAHELATEVEALIASKLKPEARVISHIEPKSAEQREERWEAS